MTVGAIWKSGRQWKIQMPRGLHTTTSKVEAEMHSAYTKWRVRFQETGAGGSKEEYFVAKASFEAYQDAVARRSRK